MSRHDAPGVRSRRRWWAGAVVLILGAAGLAVTWVARPNLVRNTATDPRTLLYGVGALLLVAALFLGVLRLTGRAWAAGAAVLVPVGLVVALVVVPTFRATTVTEADPLTELAAALGTTPPATPTGTPPATAAAPDTTTAAAPGPRELGAAGLVGIDHDASGTASIIDLGDGTSVVRFADLDVEPGPDYFVYLLDGAGVRTPDGGVLLGGLKGTQGDQNYVVPAATVISGDTTVLIWCRAFVTPVASATITV